MVRVQAFAAIENKASQRVLEKAGFLKGMFMKYAYLRDMIKDVVFFSFLSTDTIPSD